MRSTLFLLSLTLILFSCSSNDTSDSTQTKETPVEQDGPVALDDNEQQRIENDLKAYIDAFNARDWDQVTDMMYPKLFDQVAKEMMIQSFEGMEMNIVTEFKALEHISPKLELGNESYCRIYYHGILEIEMGGSILENRDPFMVEMRKSFGADNITEISNEKIHIDSHKSMIGIYIADTDKWHYMEYTKDQDPFLSQLIPAKAVDHLMASTNPLD